jgi:hypothetical protein
MRSFSGRVNQGAYCHGVRPRTKPCTDRKRDSPVTLHPKRGIFCMCVTT